MKTFYAAIALTVSLFVVAGDSPAEEKKADEGKPPVRVTGWMAEMFKSLNLSDDQKASIEKLNKESGLKVRQVVARMENVLTAEQKKARADAIKAAIAAGKKGQELANAARSR